MILFDSTELSRQMSLTEHNETQKARVLKALLRGEIINPDWGHRNRISAYEQRISNLRAEGWREKIKDRIMPGTKFTKEYYYEERP